MSESWRFHCEYIRAAVIRDGFLFPSFFLGKESFGKAGFILDPQGQSGLLCTLIGQFN